jgi:hypothetical protein
MSDELTKPLIEKSVADDRKVSFADDVFVRESGLFSKNGERLYSVDGNKTNSTSKNKSDHIGPTRFGSSETAKKLDPEQLQKIKNEEEEIRIKDKYLKKNGMEEFIAEYGEDEYKKLYVCDDEKKCCGEKCGIMGGKKTKRRRYTKKHTRRHRSKKSHRNKKSSKNKSR